MESVTKPSRTKKTLQNLQSIPLNHLTSSIESKQPAHTAELPLHRLKLGNQSHCSNQVEFQFITNTTSNNDLKILHKGNHSVMSFRKSQQKTFLKPISVPGNISKPELFKTMEAPKTVNSQPHQSINLKDLSKHKMTPSCSKIFIRDESQNNFTPMVKTSILLERKKFYLENLLIEASKEPSKAKAAQYNTIALTDKRLQGFRLADEINVLAEKGIDYFFILRRSEERREGKAGMRVC